MHLLNIKKKLPAKEAEEFEDLITNVHVEMKCQEWIQKSRKLVLDYLKLQKMDIMFVKGISNLIKVKEGTQNIVMYLKMMRNLTKVMYLKTMANMTNLQLVRNQ